MEATLLSMTGYGAASWTNGKENWRVQIKSLNSRYLDIQLVCPDHICINELMVRHRLQQHLHRGKIQCIFSPIFSSGSLSDQQVESMRRYAQQIKEWSQRWQCSEQVLATLFPPAPHLFQAGFATQLFSEKVLKKLVDEAIQACLDTQKKEGKRLQDQLFKCLEKMVSSMHSIDLHAPKRIQRLKKLHEVRRQKMCAPALSNNLPLEESDALTLWIDKWDIEEERIRLHSHLHFFKNSLTAPPAQVGKQLTFLTQEIHRELNTMSAKAQDVYLQHILVQMKESLHQMQEQLQNIK